ncbi:venom serine protease 34 isoform X2 [Xylocopa sonorina]|uniref:venom serine protease 34 isoform X2 n=1 Tax=Xylocopa sonorina TaxID=1818115 RepID=UPI00403B1996
MTSVNCIIAIDGIIAKAVLLLVCCLIFPIEPADLRAPCNYQQYIVPGESYNIYNPNYPSAYRGSQLCKWIVESEYRINLTCSAFHLPWSKNCVQDGLSVQTNASNVQHRYCGDGTFNLISDSPSMILTLTAPFWTRGGTFFCQAEAIKRPIDYTECKCGWKNPSRIVGGNVTGVNEYPMMAGIMDIGIQMIFCGSTIISTKFVLTAGHCVYNRETNELRIVVGEHDVDTEKETNATRYHSVAKIIVHPNYDPATQLNDLALVQTEYDIEYNLKVGPACLPFQHSPDTFGGSFVDILGWGSTDFAEAPSNVLLKVTVSVITNLQCSKSYRDITSDQVCTYTKGKDSCQMDSGGPILWQNPTTENIVLVGVISKGGGCAVTPGINIRVGAYIDWIISTTNSSYCIIE